MRRLVVTLSMLLLPTAASADWREATSPHFLIYSQGSEKSLRQRAERLEAFHNLLLASYRLQSEPKPYRVRIFVLDNADQLGKYMEHPDSDVRGFYRPMTEGPVVFIPENTGVGDASFSSQIVLFHEYSHHFQLQNFPVAYPPWYVEGHAELVATASFEKPGTITFGKVAESRRDELYGLHSSASEMLLKPPSVATGTGLSYGFSWLLTHYLTFSPERKGQLASYLAAINGGVSLADAAKVFGDLRKLDQDMSRYLEAGSFPYVSVPIPASVASGIVIRTLAPDEAALLPLQMEYTKPMDAPEAKAFAARVAATAALYPDSPAALSVLIKAQDDAHNYDAALAAADHLVAIAPTSARAHALRAQLLVDRARSYKGDGQARDIADANPVGAAMEGRKEAITANRLDPDDPLPLIAYFQSFGAAGTAPSKTAIDGLGRAFDIVPQDEGTRITYARALFFSDQKAQAAAILRPLANSPHQDRSAKVAFHMLARLEGREPGNPMDEFVEKKTDASAPPKKDQR